MVVNIGSGDDDNKLLPEPIIDQVPWCHMVSLKVKKCNHQILL